MKCRDCGAVMVCPSCHGHTAPLPVKIDAPLVNSPTRPVPKQGCRLPEGWMPDRDVIEAMKLQFPFCTGEWFRQQHEVFTDYWQAKTGKDATKMDWNATWRNWIRRAANENPHLNTNGHGGRLGGADVKAAGWQAMKGR